MGPSMENEQLMLKRWKLHVMEACWLLRPKKTSTVRWSPWAYMHVSECRMIIMTLLTMIGVWVGREGWAETRGRRKH